MAHTCLKDRNKSLIFRSALRDHFRNAFPKYTPRVNTAISKCRLGRRSCTMKKKPPEVLFILFYPTPQHLHAFVCFFYFLVLPFKVQHYLLKSVFKIGSVVYPDPEIT